MDATVFITRKRDALAAAGRSRVLVGVCGRAGAGKSSLVRLLAASLAERGIPALAYAGDWRFLLTSAERKRWLGERARSGLTEYFHSLNQLTWWDFTRIRQDLASLMAGREVGLDKAYDRETGAAAPAFTLGPLPQGVVLYDNAILGGVECLAMMDLILLVNTPDAVCFERTLRRDSPRRTLPEIAARYLVTTYSENVFFATLKGSDKVVTCDDRGNLGGSFPVIPIADLPVPLEAIRAAMEGVLEPSRTRPGP